MIPPEFLGFHWYDQSDLGVAVRYQFDWWGKQRAAMEGAIDRARASAAERAGRHAGRWRRRSATAYFDWQADSARVALQEQAVALRERLARASRRRAAAADLDNADAVLEATASWPRSANSWRMARGARQLDLVNLAGLLGVDAAALPALSARPLPRVDATLPADAGTNLLARRPDIQASRWRVEAALRDTDAARASFYPDISLHALAGTVQHRRGQAARNRLARAAVRLRHRPAAVRRRPAPRAAPCRRRPASTSPWPPTTTRWSMPRAKRASRRPRWSRLARNVRSASSRWRPRSR